MMNATRRVIPPERDQAPRTRIRTKRSWKKTDQEKTQNKPVMLREPHSPGIDAQELCTRLEAVAKAGPPVLGINREKTEENWDKVGGVDMNPARKSIYVEELPENRRLSQSELLDGFQYPLPKAKLDTVPELHYQEAASQYPSMQLPEIEIMENGELFSPRLLEQVEEVDEPPDTYGQKTESSQSRSPTSTLRRVAPLEDPRKAYQSHQPAEESSSTKSKLESDQLEVYRREAAEQGTSRGVNRPYTSHNERWVNDELFSAQRLSAHNLQWSGPISDSTRFADERQAWNGTYKPDRNILKERRRSLPWLLTSKTERGVGSETDVTQEHQDYGRASMMPEQRDSMLWRLSGKRNKGEGFGTYEHESSSGAVNRRRSLGFLKIFKRRFTS